MNKARVPSSSCFVLFASLSFTQSTLFFCEKAITVAHGQESEGEKRVSIHFIALRPTPCFANSTAVSVGTEKKKKKIDFSGEHNILFLLDVHKMGVTKIGLGAFCIRGPNMQLESICQLYIL
jgi:hypothetical protein